MMESSFHAARLEPADARRAYALVQFYDPDLRMEDWISFFEGRREVGQEFLAMRDTRGYAHALLGHRIEQDLRFGRVLRLSEIACSALLRRSLRAAMFAIAERLARESGCAGVLIELADAAGPGAAPGGPPASVDARYDLISTLWFRPVAGVAR